MKNRRAFTLVELLVAMSMGTVLLLLGIGMVHRTMHMASATRRIADTERAATRLSRQFRNDVHRAEAASIDGEQGLRLQIPGERPVSYRIEGAEVLREQPRDNEEVHRERFAFPENTELRVAALDAPARLALTAARDTGLVGVPPRLTLHAEAVIGRLARLRPSEEASP